MSVSAGRTIGRAAFTRVKSCGSTSASSCGAFCSTYCRTASTAFATTAATPTDRYNDDDNGPTASNDESPPCPCCGGRMKIIEIFEGPLSRPYHARKLDGL